MNKSLVLLTGALAASLVLAGCGTSSSCVCQGEVRNAEIGVGDPAPDFRLRDHTGRTIKLDDYVGKQNVVLAFLPGAFTPV